MKQQGRDVAPEAAAVAFLLCWPKQITGASWNRNTLLSNLESWNNRIRQLIGFFSYPYGVGRGRKVAIVRILLLRRSSVPLWAALLGTCITEQSLLQCMGLHWECARTKRLMLPKLWMITSPFLPAWIGHNACCPVYAALLHLSPTPLLCGVFFFFQMHLGIQSWEQNRCWFIPSGRELLPSSFSLMKLLQCCLPGWTCPFIPI